MFPLNYQFESSTSTQDEVEKYLFQTDFGAALYTFNQIQGRGQYGNQWLLKKDENLAYSLMIHEGQIATSLSLINFHTALIVRDFLANLTQGEVFVKWPNDLIIHGKKVCGILIERKKYNNEYYLTIGIGINVLQTEFEALSKAGSIYTQTSKKFDLKQFTLDFHRFFSYHITLSHDSLMLTYNEHLFNRNRVALFMVNQKRQNGIIKNVDEEGFLWIELEEDGLSRFFHKEVEMLY